MIMKKNLLWLLAVVVILALLVLATGGDERSSLSEKQLFAGIDGEQVAKLRLEGEGKSVELELKDGTWTLPARDGYRADGGKVRSLMLKVFDLRVSQKVTDSAASFGELGVADDRYAGKVALLDAAGKELGGLLLGESRKARRGAAESSAPAGGQYVRRVGTNDVYMIMEAVAAPTDLNYWLQTELVSVAQSKIRAVKQVKLASGAESPEFEIVRQQSSGAEVNSGFTLKEPLPEGEQLQDAVLSQVSAGIENARFDDVLSNAGAQTKLAGLNYDQRTEYAVSNGLRYQVLTAEKDGKYYAKVSVTFDPALAKEVEDEVAQKNEELKKKQEEEKANQAASSSSVSAGSDEGKKKAELQPVKAELSTPEEAAKLQASLEPWVYELAKYQAERFRKTRPELFKAKMPAEDKK